MAWICNKCGKPVEEVDVETKYLEFDGFDVGVACEECGRWWVYADTAERLRKSEMEADAKMV